MSKPSLSKIEYAICKECGIDKGIISSKMQANFVLQPRRLFITIANHFEYKQGDIGEYINRDHSTISHHLSQTMYTHDVPMFLGCLSKLKRIKHHPVRL